jgi:hypothetical protein
MVEGFELLDLIGRAKNASWRLGRPVRRYGKPGEGEVCLGFIPKTTTFQLSCISSLLGTASINLSTKQHILANGIKRS